MLRFGLDFGTSNSTLAVSDGMDVRVLPLDPVQGEVLPSVLYIRRDGSSLVGRAAIDAYLADNVARGPVRRQARALRARVESSVPGVGVVEAHILTDVDSPGRLFQALKTFLGDPLVGTTSVFGDAKGLEELIALLLSHVRERAAALTGETPASLALGRPVEFIGGPAAEARALERLGAAAELAGFRDVRFVAEPVGAAYAARVTERPALVFDFGGGTLDLAVALRQGVRIDVLATAGADIGGDRCTELLIEEHVAPRLGAGVTWGPKRLALPLLLTNAIRDWHALSSLNEKGILDALDDLVRAGAPAREVAALRSAIELQLGYEIFAAADAAKCRLSSERATLLTYHRAAVDVDARPTRYRFEQLLATMLRRTDELVAEVLRRAGIGAADVAEVVRTGGSSAIPAFRRVLERRLPAARIRDLDPYTSVAAGLATIA